jgi:putative sterol carrier protein
MEVFTDEWARACCEALNRSDAYRASAAAWEGSIVLAMSPDAARGVEEARAVFIDAHRGECRGAWMAGADEIATATYVLRADPGTWQRLFDREIDPVGAVMQGKLRLERGGLFALAKFAQAAKDMIAAASRVGGAFPDA